MEEAGRSLEWLKLGDNQLSAIPAESLRRLEKLMDLNLRRNRIDKILKDDFKDYGSTLQFIYLQENRIHTIEMNALSELDSLGWLYLSFNKLSVVSNETFHSVLDTLQAIDLSGECLNSFLTVVLLITD
ncbi:hypothetical protein AVEN_45258-1 [Araneus ventricosus]|uniref:Uncharacterized protein n=1 Tax=Araneus ventricosus TaxID=182803 RepID=A0A4Y2X2L6_ARAVE|nr:hypothetical protein AVEN_45258-1 [Araneus ventricosus]